MTKPRIAIPVPHSQKPEYNARSLPQYERAVRACGGEPVRIPLDAEPEEIAKLIRDCQGVLLPGSPADVDPQKFGEAKDPHTNPADAARDNVDELLIQDAYNMHKPLFGICYGLQSLNVWRSGTLLQHIEGTDVNHEAGRTVAVAHTVNVEPASRFAKMIAAAESPEATIEVNSSHHQSAAVVGDGLRVVARSPHDDVIEAIEGTNPEHFVIAVQWHPERSFETDAASKALFEEFVTAAKNYKPRPVAVSV
ncbi:MAG TPA: gamma-glutamyl-gamma-aminobutyrate hydrolase family protein [Terriglobales bacterium]|nr:gamma-glutamyl-gamma-aminobutyrate hydrolase family protein [Terriglobales bacterium]